MRLVGDQPNGGLAVGPLWMMNQNPQWNTQVPDIQVTTYDAVTPQTGFAVDTIQTNAQEGFSVKTYQAGAQAGADVTTYKTGAAGMTVTTYKAISAITSIPNLIAAQTIIGTPANQLWTRTEVAPYINYDDNVGNVNTTLIYPGAVPPAANPTAADVAGLGVANRAFPGLAIGSAADYYAVKATGTIHIPTTGDVDLRRQ